MNAMELTQSQLVHMGPILATGAIAIVITFERTQALYSKYSMKNSRDFFEKISSFVSRGKIQEAQNYCDRYPQSLVAQVSKSALSRAHLPETVIEDGLQLAVNEANQAVTQKTSYLATIANIATLLGLLGTILGLIHSFEAVGHADAQQKSALLSEGIATSMNATLFGLGVAIPCMIAFSILTHRSNKLISDVEDAAVRTLDMIKQRQYGQGCEEDEEAPSKSRRSA